MTHVDVTFRNVNEEVLRNFKAEAVREDKTFGEALAEAIKLWLEHRGVVQKTRKKLSDSKSLCFHSGVRNLSERVDEILYTR